MKKKRRKFVNDDMVRLNFITLLETHFWLYAATVTVECLTTQRVSTESIDKVFKLFF